MPAPVALALVCIFAAALVFGPEFLNPTGSDSSSSRWLVENDPAPVEPAASGPPVQDVPRPSPDVPAADGGPTASNSPREARDESAPAADEPPRSPAPSPEPPVRSEPEVAAHQQATPSAAAREAAPRGTVPEPISASGQLVAEVQRRLRALGYDAGPVDGRAGPRTRDALRAYQRENGLAATGDIDATVLFRLGFD